MAERDEFQFNTPIHVEWKRLDEKPLRSFWSSTPALQALRQQLPGSVDKVLVLHRGVGIVRARGMYLWRSEYVPQIVSGMLHIASKCIHMGACCTAWCPHAYVLRVG